MLRRLRRPAPIVVVTGRFSRPRPVREPDQARHGRAARRGRVRRRRPGRGPADARRAPRGRPARADRDGPEPLAAARCSSASSAPGPPAWSRFREAPAAKYYHQAYVGGLLEHTLSVAQAVSAAASYFPGIDRDIAVTGALLHDIGKTEAYNDDPLAIDLTDAGRLLAEIPLGYYKVRREIEEIEGFDPDLAQAVLHIILSHHGQLEHGSPVVPCTREATLVHAMDNLGGKLGSFDRLETRARRRRELVPLRPRHRRRGLLRPPRRLVRPAEPTPQIALFDALSVSGREPARD